MSKLYMLVPERFTKSNVLSELEAYMGSDGYHYLTSDFAYISSQAAKQYDCKIMELQIEIIDHSNYDDKT